MKDATEIAPLMLEIEVRKGTAPAPIYSQLSIGPTHRKPYSTPKGKQTKSHSISSLLIRSLEDVFGENDPARRRTASGEIFHEDALYCQPDGVYRGHDEIDRIAGVIKATHPDFRYQPIAPPEELGDGGRVRWVSGSPGSVWEAESKYRLA